MTDDASPENLRKFLESDDPALRRMGLSLAKGAGVPEELYKNVVRLALWDPEEENRDAAGELVEDIGLENITEFPGWLEPFEEGEVDVVVRRAAAYALGGIGKPAVELLITALGDDDDYVRRSASTALGKIGDERAVEPLIEVLSYEDEDGDENVRWDVVRVLGEIGDSRAVEPLIEVLLHTPSALGCYIVYVTEALDKLGWVPETDRQRAAYSIAAEDWKSVVECGESAVETLIGMLTPGWYMAKPAIEALGEIGSARAVEPLIGVLWVEDSGIKDEKYQDDDDDSYDYDLREAAVEALGKIGDARAVEPLILALYEPGPDVAEAAVEALGEIGDARAVEPLTKLLDGEIMEYGNSKKHYNDDVRDAAKEALRKLGHEVE